MIEGQKRFTCSSCLVVFPGFEEQRAHYQAEWHRFNLIRKVKGHPPVTEAQYAEYLSKLDSNSQPEPIHKQPKRASDPLHLPKSEEEAERIYASRLEKKLDLESDCIFCSSHKSTTFAENLEHMTIGHGLYIPDLEYLCDLRGLMEYLAEKVAVGFCCLYCEERRSPFQSLEAVRRHMADKSHLRIRFDDDGTSELSEFYNWDRQQQACAPGLADSDWSDVDEEAAESDALVTPDGTELVLPSGSMRIGNRAYSRYYRQRLGHDSDDELEAGGLARSRALRRYEKPEDRLLAVARHSSEEKRDQKFELSRRLEQELALGVKANKLQPHFRLQIR